MTLALFLVVPIASIALRLPVAFALQMAAIALMRHMDLFSADILSQSLINGVDSFAPLAIPFFFWRAGSCQLVACPSGSFGWAARWMAIAKGAWAA